MLPQSRETALGLGGLGAAEEAQGWQSCCLLGTSCVQAFPTGSMSPSETSAKQRNGPR